MAEGYDQQRFVRFMCKQKGKLIYLWLTQPIDTTPNVDYFTREEIRAVVKEFKDEETDAQSDVSNPTPILTSSVQNSSSRNSLIDGSTAKLFDEMMNRRRSSTAMKRRKTNTANETILN
jgi:hypothetical protein